MVSLSTWISTFGGETPYQMWQKVEGIPSIKGFYVEDLNTIDLAPWPRKGGKGAFINLEGSEHAIDAYVHEIPPGGASQPEKHFYEENIFVLQGRGASNVWVKEGDRKQTFEWQEGSFFSMPLNVWHQHFNGQGDKPARYVGVTRAPLMINYFHDLDLIFNCDFVFPSRYQAEEAFFSGKGKSYPGRVWETNFVADAYGFQLEDYKTRGAGSTNIHFEFTNSSLGGHISEFPVGTYKKAHCHGPGAEIILLSGYGYSLMWPKEAGERVKVPWKKGSMFVPPNQWWHQHFNAGREPARYLVFGSSVKYGILKFRAYREGGPDLSFREGGIQCEYEDENPEIRQTFEAELAKEGLACKMPPFNYRRKA
ncbi:MAG: reactivating factor for ethanolamine ammonia lyase [Dehalococcoidia bacterium]|nr:reactivating factor for ethanolamine ammonia lyase [Dehalococcoidia bacterium]